MNEMNQIHKIYYKYLNRTCEYGVTRRILKYGRLPNILRLENEVRGSDEARAVKAIRRSLSTPDQFDFIDQVTKLYLDSVERLPTNQEIKKALDLEEQFQDAMAINILESVIRNTDDYKYLSECKSYLPKKTVDIPVDSGDVTIKYCFPLGTSGISKIAQDIIRSLAMLPNVKLELSCIQFHNFHQRIEHDIAELYSHKLSNYDYVIIHGFPEFIPSISKVERKQNSNVKIYAIVAWETDQLPVDWLPWLQYADKISCPSTFNASSFRKESDLLPPVDVVHHPVEVPILHLPPVCPIYELKKSNKYVFYNISEWSNRKGVTELINAFSDTFAHDQSTWLYIKTFGDVDEASGRDYVASLKLTNVYLDYNRVSDEYIDCIHRCGDCFVSLTNAEGHFIGACIAHFMNKPVILTGASGHLDYLLTDSPNCHLIPAVTQPAVFCHNIGTKHQHCRIMPHCIYFPKFVPCQMNWFKPDHEVAKSLMLQVRYAVTVIKNPSALLKTWIVQFSKQQVGLNFLDSLQRTCIYPKRQHNLSVICRPQFLSKYEWRAVDNQIKGTNLRANVLLINAGFYGNVGDYLYTFIISNFFEQTNAVNLMTISDTQCVLSDDKVIPIINYNQSRHRHKKVDYIIIGGGGLLNKERLRPHNCLSFYAKYAQERNVPLYLLSVGFQDIHTTAEGSLKNHDWIVGYKELLNAASYISVRSLFDYSLVQKVTGYMDMSKVRFHPDLVYSLFKVVANLPVPQGNRDTVTVIYSEKGTEYLQMTFPPHKTLIFMNFGGNFFKRKVFDRLQDLASQIAEKYPYALFYHGLEFDPSIVHYIGGDCVDASDLHTFSLPTAIKILMNTKFLYTTRYHGYILGKLCKVPQILLRDPNNYKIRADVVSNNEIDTNDLGDNAFIALKNIETMIIEEIKFAYKSWGDDRRNSTIAKLTSMNEYPVSLFQSLTNRQLQLAEQTEHVSFMQNINEICLE
jgi:exopolysaccharide biosynthesis predicted pyruvyltransferase EpsI